MAEGGYDSKAVEAEIEKLRGELSQILDSGVATNTALTTSTPYGPRTGDGCRQEMDNSGSGRKDYTDYYSSPNFGNYDRDGARAGQYDTEMYQGVGPAPQDGYRNNSPSTGYRVEQRTDTGRKTVNIKPATYDGSGSWRDYQSHFEACASINQWTMEQKGLFLAVSLRGQAQGVLGNLPDDRQQHYSVLIKSLEDRFAPPHQTELYRAQLRSKRQKAGETLPELGQTIRRLTTLAYSTAPADVLETLAKEQFIDALSDGDSRIRIKQCRPKTLNEAVQLAVELETFKRAEKRKDDGTGFLRQTLTENNENEDSTAGSELKSMIKTLTEQMESLQKDVSNLKSGTASGERKRPRKENGGTKGTQTFRCYY